MQRHTAIFCGLALLSGGVAAQDHVYTWYGDAPENLGRAVSGIGDVDADGHPDFLAGAPSDGTAPGQVVVYSGFTGNEVYRVASPVLGDNFGYAARSCGDVNGDGVEDFIVGAPNDDTNGTDSGRAYVFSGVDGATIHTLTGDDAGDRFGQSVCGAGDTTGDGFPDLLVGAPAAGGGAGEVLLFSGPDGTRVRRIVGGFGDTNFGFVVRPLGDVNDDNRADWLVGCPGGLTVVDHDRTGYASIISGMDSSPLMTYYGTRPGALAGWSVDSAGDVDGDGYPDVIVGMPSVIPNGTLSGAALVYSSVRIQYLDSFPGGQRDQLGSIVAGVGDVNGDGRGDVLIGEGSRNAGNAFIRSGMDGSLLFEVPRNRGQVGGLLDAAALGDIDGDGRPDFIVGSGNSLNGGSGAAHVYSSERPLSSEAHRVRVRTTDRQNLTLDAGAEHAGKPYLLVGSMSGTTPGIALGTLTLPLNFDWYTGLLAAAPNGLILGSQGTLDASGQASAAFVMQSAIPLRMAGTVMHHAYLVVAPDLSAFDFVSNAVPLTFAPRF